jgi:hypothetical protein
MPGVSFTYLMPFWDWNVAYNYDYRIYAKKSRSNEDTHNLLATGLIRLLDDFLLLDINDTYSRVSLDISRDRTQESLNSNQSDTNNFTASPYLQFHPVNLATIRTGYRYTNVWYKDPTAIDRRDHMGYIDASYDFSTKLTLNANNTYTHENSTEGYDRNTSYVGGRYDYMERSFVNANFGYTINKMKHGKDSNKPYWNAVITHSFDHTTVTLNSAVQYPIDPESGVTREIDYSLAVNREFIMGRAGINLSYSKYSGTGIDVEKRYGVGLNASRELLPNLSGTISCSFDRYEHKESGTYSRRILVNPALNYALPHEISLVLNYVFVDSYSQNDLEDRYKVNRVSLEIRKSFGREVQVLGISQTGATSR